MNRLNILILAANPTGVPLLPSDRTLVGPGMASGPLPTQPIDFASEIEKIRERVRASKYRDLARIELRLDATPDRLAAAIDECRPNIIHFIGHSDEAGIG